MKLWRWLVILIGMLAGLRYMGAGYPFLISFVVFFFTIALLYGTDK